MVHHRRCFSGIGHRHRLYRGRIISTGFRLGGHFGVSRRITGVRHLNHTVGQCGRLRETLRQRISTVFVGGTEVCLHQIPQAAIVQNHRRAVQGHIVVQQVRVDIQMAQHHQQKIISAFLANLIDDTLHPTQVGHMGIQIAYVGTDVLVIFHIESVFCRLIAFGQQRLVRGQQGLQTGGCLGGTLDVLFLHTGNVGHLFLIVHHIIGGSAGDHTEKAALGIGGCNVHTIQHRQLGADVGHGLLVSRPFVGVGIHAVLICVVSGQILLVLYPGAVSVPGGHGRQVMLMGVHRFTVGVVGLGGCLPCGQIRQVGLVFFILQRPRR